MKKVVITTCVAVLAISSAGCRRGAVSQGTSAGVNLPPSAPAKAPTRSALQSHPVPTPKSTPVPRLVDASGRVKSTQQLKPLIQHALKENITLKGLRIEVTAHPREIVLSGNVKNEAQKTVAANVASQFTPIYSVKNNLIVK